MGLPKTTDGLDLDTPIVMTNEEFEKFNKTEHVRVIRRVNGDIKRFTCAGIDVHKKILVVAVCVTDKQTFVPTYHVYKTHAINKKMGEMCKWLKSFGVVDVCMESTGKYWIPVFNYLERHGFKPIIAHPKYLKAPRGKKNDVQDAMHIANVFRMDLVKPSFIPPEDIRDIRNLCRYSIKLTCDKTAEKNRYQNNLAECNLRLDHVFTDVFGKSSQKIMQMILEDGPDNLDRERIKASLDKKCKATVDTVLDAIEGGDFIGSQHELIQLHLHHIEEIDYLLASIQFRLEDYIKKYQKQVDHICSMVGVNKSSAIFIIGEIGADMSVWESADCLSSWAGVVPASNSSAGKNKSVKIGTGGYYLKPILVQCVNAALKSTKEPYFAIKYNGIKGRRGHKKAVIAIAHKMLVSIYHMLKNDVDFLPKDYEAVVQHYKKEEAHKSLKLEEAAKILLKNGADKDDLEKIMSQCKSAKAKKASSKKTKKAASAKDTKSVEKTGSVAKVDTPKKTSTSKKTAPSGETDPSEETGAVGKTNRSRKPAIVTKTESSDPTQTGTARKSACTRKTSSAKKKAAAGENDTSPASVKKTTRSGKKTETVKAG